MIIRKINKYLKLPGKEKIILFQCLWLLVKTNILIEFFSMKQIKKYLGEPVKNERIEGNRHYERSEVISEISSEKKDRFGSLAMTDNENFEIIRIVTRNIRRGAKIIPWKIKCYPQALSGKILLKKYDINSYLYLGLNKEDNKLNAHAWLNVNEKTIIGHQSADKFTSVGIFS